MNLESSWIVYRTRFLVHARQLSEPLSFIDPLGREHSGIPGDYLVESAPGFRRITPRAIFEDVYVPLPPQDACATSASIEPAMRVLDQCMARRNRSLDRRALAPRSDQHFSSSPSRPVPNWSG